MNFSCALKFKHKSEKAAKRSIRRGKGRRITPYLCGKCHYWHVGSSIG